MAGLTSTGFEAKTAAEILEDVETRQKALMGDDLDVSPEQPLGQTNGIFAAALRELWELGAAVYAARDPRGAGGDALTSASLLTGTERRGLRPGQVALGVTLAAGVTLPAGSIARVPSAPTNRWVTAADVTNLGIISATLYVLAEQETPGPVPAAATTISEIATPVAGWLSVTNLAAAIPGAAAEGDPALRRRREAEVQGAASSPVDAIAAALSAVPLVTDVTVTENGTDATDADGRPPHSVEALVVGGDDAAVALALWRAKAGGVATYGAGAGLRTVTVGDRRGEPRVVRFSRPAAALLYVVVAVRVDARRPPTVAAIQAAVLAVGAALRPGEAVRHAALVCAALDVAGVRDVFVVAVGPALAFARPENFAVGARELATFDAARIEVSLVP